MSKGAKFQCSRCGKRTAVRHDAFGIPYPIRLRAARRRAAGDAVSAAPPSKTTLGLPFPWVMKAHKRIGDRLFFFSVSPLTLALGFEFLRDGFVLVLGPLNIGWASISSFDKRAAEEREQFERAVASRIEARQGGNEVPSEGREPDPAKQGDAQ